MSSYILLNCVIIAGCASLAFVPFVTKRSRAGWAKSVFVIVALGSVTGALVRLAVEFGWFTLGTQASCALNDYLYMLNGVLLGFLFSLILSGELRGKASTA